jgi:Zn-finger domain-containing protein
MKVSLPKNLKDFVTEQVHTALRQMEEAERDREMRAFESAFRQIDRHSPVGELTAEDLAEINRIVTAVRGRR